MVGASACGDSQEASHCDSTQDGRARQANFGAPNGSAITRLVWVNKAVPASPVNLGVAGTYLTVYNRAKH